MLALAKGEGDSIPPPFVTDIQYLVQRGALGINITSRLLQHATRTPNGLFASDVNVPKGNHCVIISVTDNLSKVGTRMVNLHVLG